MAAMDEESGFSYCRLVHGPNCSCEKAGKLSCERIRRIIIEERPDLDEMRKAIVMQAVGRMVAHMFSGLIIDYGGLMVSDEPLPKGLTYSSIDTDDAV